MSSLDSLNPMPVLINTNNNSQVFTFSSTESNLSFANTPLVRVYMIK